MEELRSTEILDKEIRVDSQKQAELIGKEAEKTAAELIAGVTARLESARSEAEKASQERLDIFKKNSESSLPLEKQRFLVSYIYSSVLEGINSYFDSLTEKKRLDIVKTLVERTKPVCKGRKMNALVYGMNVDSAEKMLKTALGTAFKSAEEGNIQDLNDEKLEGFTRREGVILKAEDGSLTCRLTLDQKVKELLDNYNFELSKTLFGGRLPE